MESTIFSGVSDAALAELNNRATRHRFSRGDVIVHKGQNLGGVYAVLSGSLRVYTLDSQGNEKPIYELHSGEICLFTINCVMGRVVYPAWVAVDSDFVDVLAVPAQCFRELYESDPLVRDRVMEALSQGIFDLMSAVEAASVFEVGDRINSFLVRSCGNSGCVHLGHQDIANRLGTAREVVSRHLKQLEREGLVELSRMKITISDPLSLAARLG